MNLTQFFVLLFVLIALAVIGEVIGRKHIADAKRDARNHELEALRSETRAGFATLEAALSAKAEMRHAEVLAAFHHRSTTPADRTQSFL